jgi:hypothetical protein
MLTVHVRVFNKNIIPNAHDSNVNQFLTFWYSICTGISLCLA